MEKQIKTPSGKYKAMTISQLAAAAGVSRPTMLKWIIIIHKQLEPLGLRPGMHCLPPSVVGYIVAHYDIDLD